MTSEKNQGVIWTPLMPDRRRLDRRRDISEYHSASRAINISDRRNGNDRRKTETITVTGRAMEIGQRSKRTDS